eukprot:gene6981-7049_t
MPQFLSSLIGDSKIMQAGALIALAIAVLLTIGIIIRAIFYSRVRAASARGRQPRLAVVDVFDLDRNRQLVLVRRDQVEHLVMIGGPNDVVVESGIIRTVVAARDRERSERDNMAMPLAMDLAAQKVNDIQKTDEIKAAVMPLQANADFAAAIVAETTAPVNIPQTYTQQLVAPQPPAAVAPPREPAVPAPVKPVPAKAELAAPKPDVNVHAPEVHVPPQQIDHAAQNNNAPAVNPVEVPAYAKKPSEMATNSDRPALRSQFIQRAAPLPRTLTPLTQRPLNLTSTGFSPRPMTTPKPPVAQPPAQDTAGQLVTEANPIDDLEMEMARLLGHPVKLD